MNNLKIIHSEYLRSNRTVETILVTQGSFCKTLWIYNFEGVHFRVFESLIEIFNFFDGSDEPKFSFEDENELDQFLLNFKLFKHY